MFLATCFFVLKKKKKRGHYSRGDNIEGKTVFKVRIQKKEKNHENLFFYEASRSFALENKIANKMFI